MEKQEEMEGFNINDIINKVVALFTKPAAFFKEMPKTGGYVEPLIFVAIMGLLAGVVAAILSIVGLQPGGVGVGISLIILMPVFMVIGSFIGAGILFLIWKLMGSNENYETAYRCIAYISVFSPISVIAGIIPYIGSLAILAAEIYYIVLASINVHNIEAKKAWLVFGIIGALLALMSIGSQMAASKAKSEMGQYQDQSKELQKQIEKMQQEQNQK